MNTIGNCLPILYEPGFKVITGNEATLDNIGCQTTLDIDNFVIIWMIIFMILVVDNFSDS